MDKPPAGNMQVCWQLLGSTEIHSTLVEQGVKETVQSAVQDLTGVLSKWVEVSFGGILVPEDISDLDKICEKGACSENGSEHVLQCSLLLPRYCLLAERIGPPRVWKKQRILNQPSVRETAEYPELLSHEGPLADSPHCSYVVYVEGIQGLPSRYLRLELGTAAPTVGTLLEKLGAVVVHVSVAFGTTSLTSGRTYLHRIGLMSGGVVTVSGGCRETATPNKRMYECSDGASEIAQVEPKISLVHKPNRAWASSSNRKRHLISSGDCGGRLGGKPGLHDVLEESLLASDEAECRNTAGGYLPM